jgi:DNA-binding MarR family transcriptional regulator
MRSIKSPFTARKYLQKLIDEKMVIETKNPKDERSMLVCLAPKMKAKMDDYLDFTISTMKESCESEKS